MVYNVLLQSKTTEFPLKMDIENEEIPSFLNNQVSLTNLAARGAQGFTLREKRLITAGLSKLDSRKSDNLRTLLTLKERTFRVTASEYVEISGIKDKKCAYKDIKAACEHLATRQLRYKIITPKGIRGRVLNWVSSLTYHEGEGWVEFTLSDEIMPHISDLHGRFTRYRLHQASELRSIYSWRLLELLTSHNDAKNETKIQIRKISIEELRQALEIPDCYKYNDIKTRIIESAINELTTKDHWLIQWRAVKKVRTVTDIEFTFSRNPQLALENKKPEIDATEKQAALKKTATQQLEEMKKAVKT